MKFSAKTSCFGFARSGYILLFICATQTILAQNRTLDSLRESLPKLEGKIKADVLNAISKQLWESKSDSAIFFADSALKLSKKINYRRG